MRTFRPEDLETINGWYRAHGGSPISAGSLPPAGYIVEGVAAGFLYLTSAPSVALVDGFVSSPSASLRMRSAAIAAIAERLLEDAREMGVSSVLALTAKRGIARVASRLGFVAAGTYRLMAKGV